MRYDMYHMIWFICIIWIICIIWFICITQQMQVVFNPWKSIHIWNYLDIFCQYICIEEAYGLTHSCYSDSSDRSDSSEWVDDHPPMNGFLSSRSFHFHFGARKGQCLCCHMQHSLINIQKTRLSPLVIRHPRLAMYKRTGSCSSVDPAQQVVRQNHWLDCKLPGSSSQRLWDSKSKTFAKACWILLMPSRFKLSSSVAANRDLLWPQGSGISMLIQVFAKIRHLVM